MKNILFLLAIISVFFVSCDGKERVHKSNTQVLKEHKLLDSFSKVVKYFPEKYSENEIDTLFSNGHRIKIKSFSNMEDSYLNEFTNNNITYKHYYRDTKALITVTNNSMIFNEIIDKNFILNIDDTYKSFFNKSILQGVWLNEAESLNKKNISIDITFCKPETDWCEYFTLQIEANGNYKLKNVTKE
ncbi:hypothetical protein [Lacinutrix sp. 5H-3-7-4]|uniref:hypothetical protein n=1 Tax=Lacinutrix sp. (strain 5H-3-7-4) TaxID=983544 RepID=UPI00020A3CE1|nr:hypothetical protein [Lacinutrix sp. 5H-3-7-4]AEH02486.1 hypothetical protein Lacal_2646 [Lacinutrix sp. 5H-3-7-4]